MIRKLAEEEGKIIAKKLTGKLSTDEIAEMIEKVTPLINTVIGILHKKEIQNTIKWYSRMGEEAGSLKKTET